MSGASNDLAVHLRKQILARPELAYQIGPHSRTWELLCTAIASITGETYDAADNRLRVELRRVREEAGA